MLRHNMAAISEIADFRTRSALSVICSVILGLSTHSSIRESQGRNELHVCQRWRMKANDEGGNFTRKRERTLQILRPNQVCFSTLPLNVSSLKNFVASTRIMSYSLTLFLSMYGLFIVVHDLLKKCTGVF